MDFIGLLDYVDRKGIGAIGIYNMAKIPFDQIVDFFKKAFDK